jgi:hypothetical protein
MRNTPGDVKQEQPMITRPHLDDTETAVRYLADKLSSPEREAFEDRYLGHPEIVEAMELDAKLKAGLICIRDSNELDRLVSVPKRFLATMPIAIAASILLVVAGFLAFRASMPQTMLASSTAALHRPLRSQLASGATYNLVQTRTGSFDAVISLPKGPQAIRLQLVLDIEPPVPTLGVALAAIADDASRTNLAVLHQVRVDDNGIATLYLNSAAVRPGTYELSVFKESASAEAPESTFILNVIPREGAPTARSP